MFNQEKWRFERCQNGIQILEGVNLRGKVLTRIWWLHQWVKTMVGMALGWHEDCCLISQRGQRWKLGTSQGVHSLTLVSATGIRRSISKGSQVSDETQLPAGFLLDLIAWISASNWVFMTAACTKQQLDPVGGWAGEVLWWGYTGWLLCHLEGGFR